MAHLDLAKTVLFWVRFGLCTKVSYTCNMAITRLSYRFHTDSAPVKALTSRQRGNRQQGSVFVKHMMVVGTRAGVR